MNDLNFTVEHDGTLLEYVRSHLPEISSSRSKAWLTHRLISVDGAVTSRFDMPVRAGQKIHISLSRRKDAVCPLEIIYEDSALIAVNKPEGLLSVASDSEKERTAFRVVRDSGISPLFVVHRLDKDTSGVLLFARSAEIRDQLQSNWDEKVVREYIAVCEGHFAQKQGRIETFLQETKTHRMYSAPSGQRAVSNYQVLDENQRYSLVQLNLETGRKNQIRVHMSEHGNPVAGDRKYGAKTDPYRRLALHSHVLGLTHPVTGAPLRIEAPAPASLRLDTFRRTKSGNVING